MKFNEAVKNHLSEYKKMNLGVYDNGVWKRNDRPYPHILPPELWNFNLLENYRQELIGYIEETNIHLHQDFHHLNSSQALCLNFFYPLVAEQKLELLLRILNLEQETLAECEFEKLLLQKEGTNFDFYIQLQSGREILFDIKYSEHEFGKAKSIGKYRRKYEEIYKKRLNGKIRSDLKEYDELIQHYQLLRNISYVDTAGSRLLVFICPQDNVRLIQEFHEVLERVIVPEIHQNIRLITWESLLFEIIQLLLLTNAPLRLLDHYSQFEEKYLF
nr:hypothetical protein [uncultured Bacillus sp.]